MEADLLQLLILLMKEHQSSGVLAGGSFQPIASQLMQLLATIIGHLGSPDASGSASRFASSSLAGAAVLPEVPLFFSFASFCFYKTAKV